MSWKSLVVLVLLAAGLGGFFYYDTYWLAPAREKTESVKGRLWTVEPKDVQTLTLKRKTDTVKLARAGDGGWEMLEPVKTRGDRNAVDGVVTTLATLRVDREIDGSPAKLSEFGLDPQRAGILAALEQIKARAQPQDVVVVFFAGHGITLDQAYFFIPRDLVYQSDEDVIDKGLSQAELMEFLSGVAARKTLLVLDTCGSGGLVEALGTRGLAEKRALALLAKSAGSFLIAASSSSQQALETSGLGHGLLTYTLLQALGG